jgi:hypothetical protein
MGVQFYYSDDNSTWIYLGNDTTPAPTDLYQIDLDTTAMVDGNYWLMVNITDIDDMMETDIVEFIIDNPDRPPVITLLAPVNVTEVKGTIDINATAFDLDGNINSTGVSFYYSTDGVNWVLISKDPTPDIDFYTISWDTTTVQDGYYWVKAFVNDTTNLSASAISDILMVHNNLMNPPTVTVIAPNNGEEIRVNFVLKAEAFDIDDNLDTAGVTFYYSADKIDWIYIGNTPIPEVGSTVLYTLPWNTLQIPDGRYWLNASATDTTNLTGRDHSDEPFFIHNSQLNSPILMVDYPNGGETLTGTATIRAGAGDLEDNIDGNGVRFYYSSNMVNWTLIDKSPSPSSLIPISDILIPYELLWDTTKVPDGVYWLKAEATDTHNLTGFDLSDGPFIIHNNDQNAPIVVVVYPNGGEEVNGTIILESTCFDLEDNVDANGVTFYYSSDDKQTWTEIGNQVTGDLFTANPFDKLYQLGWNTTTVPDGYYWLKSSAIDLTSLIGNDTSDDYFIIHNDLNNPPIINIIQPLENDIVSSDVEIQVEVTDLENNIQEVSFYYSEDNVNWVLIGTDTEPDDNIYSISWNSAETTDGEYYLRVVATDTDGNSAEALSGKIDVDNGITKPGKDDKTDDLSDYWWLWILIVIIIILLILFAVVYQKKRKEEQMEKTLASMSPQAIPIKGGAGQLEGEPKPALAAPVAPKLLPPAGAGAGEGEEAGKDFEQKLVTWKSQGYNVSRLENLIDTDMEAFWNVLPVFINNINKLNDLKPRFNALDTTGYENEAESIRTKINEPDQTLAVEQEVIMLEDLIGQQKKLEDEEATEGAITKEEEAKADFDAFLPTGEEGEAAVGEPSEEEAAAEQELEGELKEAEDEISPEDEDELDAAEAELEGEIQAADEEIAEEKGEGEAEPDQEPSEPSEGQDPEDVEDDEEDSDEMDF